MKSNSRSLAVTVLAAGAVFISALSVINAQTLQQAPDNPAFIQYQQERARKAVMPKTGSEYGRGLIPTPVDFSYLKGRTPASLRTLRALPSTYDLRTLGKLTPIKNQDPYGTCWAFATYGSLESALMPAEERYFSVNNMVNNHGFDYGYDDGGTFLMSIAYLSRWSGPINNAVDPYPNPGHSPSGLTVQKHVQEALILSGKASALDNNTIKQAVMNYGAVYVSMYSDFNTNYYYNPDYFSFYYDGASNTDHAVAIVGWDDDYSSGKFRQTPPGNGAYIVRNSWGTNWGDHGYFYCSYYDSRMALHESAVFNNAGDVTNYSSVYQYDPLGRVTDYGYSSTNAWGANIFTAANNDTLRAVGFYATDVDVNYEICIYGNVTAGSPTNGTLKLSQTGTFAYSGYHTVVLNTPVEMSSGQLFSVVIKFVNPSYTYPIAIEYAKATYSSRATSSPGQSYVSTDGTSWSDLTTYDSTANVCIKAFCGTGSIGVPDASTVGDIDGDSKVDLISVVDSNWYVWFSSSGYTQRTGPVNFGISGTPVTGDINRSGKVDLIVVVDSNWYVWFSSSGYTQRTGPINLGISGTPLTGDVDGDGKADLIIVVGSNWYVWFSSSGYTQRVGPINLGISGAPAAGDIDGDGKADLIVVVDSNWYVWFSSSGYTQRTGPINLGISGVPAAGDIDGDGKADLIVIVDSNWYIWFSTLGYLVRNGPYTLNVP